MQQSQQSATTEAGKPVVSGYQVHSRLGEGGEGRVWLATHIESGARVALKILHRRIDGDDETLSRLGRGFSALAELNCRGIAGAIGRGELSSGEAWQATAFVAGRNLIEEIARIKQALRVEQRKIGDAFPIRPVLELFERVCTAVDLAHRLGVVHRDLKPANIIVDEDGQPWLVDFGIAKKPSALDATIVTLPGHFVGSIQCASPEQVEGRPELIDHRADLYSLGVILYQLTTGKFPYNVNGSLSQIFDRIRFARPVEPCTIATWMDRDLQAIILKSLEKEPSDRYSTAADMRDDIRRYLDGAPIMARNSGFATAALKFASRHRRASAVTAVVASLSIFYAISVTWLLQRATRAEAAAAAQADAARAKFRMAQETAEEILTSIDQQLKDRPDTAELRRKLLKSAYDRFSILVAEKEHDPALLVDFAKAHTRMGDIALALGLLDDCEKHRHSALEIWKKLAESHPDDVTMKAQLSIAIVLVGDLEKVRGQTGRAEALYRESLAIDESLVQSHPYNAVLANNLSWSYERVGAIVDANGAAEMGLPFHRNRHAILRATGGGRSIESGAPVQFAGEPHDTFE
ncbi:MAG: serine/threonine protein kinase [Planctomycetes bacterium]|nr:serine/threonine protein kinase [Planctomycetota bacterium]